MTFKEWFLAWPDYILTDSEFNCICGDKTWNICLNEITNKKTNITNFRKKIKNGWGPANYEIVNIKKVSPKIITIADTNGDAATLITIRFFIQCEKHEKLFSDKEMQDMINSINVIG